MNTDRKRTPPGLTDSLIIILIAGALVIFILWATSRLMALNLFENLSPWLERSYNAVWTSVVSGTAGIGLVIVKAFRRRPDQESPNYLMLIGIWALSMLLVIVLLPRVLLFASQVGAGAPSYSVETSLVSGGFAPSFMGGLPQLPGTQCGQTTIGFSQSQVAVQVNEWTEVRWDASYICRRQGIAGPVNGTVNWGTGDGKVDLLPGAAPAYGEWGSLKFRYGKPGRYTVAMDMATSCIDVGMPPNPCKATGQFIVTVTN